MTLGFLRTAIAERKIQDAAILKENLAEIAGLILKRRDMIDESMQD
jgi:hypothetical protein